MLYLEHIITILFLCVVQYIVDSLLLLQYNIMCIQMVSCHIEQLNVSYDTGTCLIRFRLNTLFFSL